MSNQLTAAWAHSENGVRPRAFWKATLLVAALPLLLAGCGSESDNNTGAGDSTSEVEKAYDLCVTQDATDPSTSDMEDIGIADGGKSVVITDASEVDGVVCLLAALGTSEALISEISSTTAMMGRQQSNEDGMDYSWSYHPDNGMNMTIRQD